MACILEYMTKTKAILNQGQLQMINLQIWTEHSHTDLKKPETREIKKIF